MTHWWYIWASEIGWGWFWGSLHWFSGMRAISCQSLQWAKGSEGHLFNCLPFPKKINFLLQVRRHQRRNGTALKWRQNTVTFFRYDYKCPLVSLLLLWRNFSDWVPLSLAGPVLFLLLIWTFVLLVSRQFIARLLVLFLSIAAGYTFCILCMYRWNPHMKHLLLLDTKILHLAWGFFPPATVYFKKSLLKPGEGG